jgi:hypothetical protein
MNYSKWNISLEWTDEEQRLLESCMLRFTAEKMDSLQRYVRMAAVLPRKSVRDVALRVRWTMLQQQLKRRTAMDHCHGRKHPSGAVGGGGGGATTTLMPPPLPPSKGHMVGSMTNHLPIGGGLAYNPAGAGGHSDGPPTVVEGPIAHLLDANLAILNHFRSNMAAFKVHENTQLLVQFRENILQIIHAMETLGGVMSQMPSLPVKLNTELANSFLPPRPTGVLSPEGMIMPPPPQPALNAPGMVPIGGPGFAPGAGAVPPPSTAMPQSFPLSLPIPFSAQSAPQIPPHSMHLPPASAGRPAGPMPNFGLQTQNGLQSLPMPRPAAVPQGIEAPPHPAAGQPKAQPNNEMIQHGGG